jgi:hypothetical protein
VQEESAREERTIAERMDEHDKGDSGATLEEVFSPAAKSVEVGWWICSFRVRSATLCLTYFSFVLGFR